ncbi:MAG: Translation initiation factor SUI1-related protein [Myxococcaceae bacterium]|nr:Translation initiation factor SUI1-related protein [Myxococcaceae bacterium]
MADKPANNPFAKLAALRDALPAGPAPVAPAAPAVEADPVKALLARRVVVRRERKGRGGKTVTVVQFPDGAEEAPLDALARELRKGLGTAAQREETAVAVQGDIADRVAAWLAARGATRIVRGD